MTTVNTSGGGDYLTLNAWVAGNAGDAGGGSPTATCTTTDGTIDSINATITGFSNYAAIIIEAAAGDEALISGVDTARYRNSSLLTVNNGNTTIRGLQKIAVPSDGVNISVNTSDAVNPVTIQNCYIQEPQYGYQGNIRGVAVVSGLCNVENTIIDGGGINSGSAAISNSSGTLNIKNTLLSAFGYCIKGAVNSIYSSVLYNPVTANWDTLPTTIAYCASDTDISGFGSNNFLMAAAVSVFNSPSTSDWTLLNYTGTGALIGAGDPINSTATDIAGTSRDSSPDIGAFEYISGVSSFSIIGNITLNFLAESTMQYNQHPSLMGDVVFNMNVEGVMAYNSSHSIIGNITLDFFAESVMQYNQHPVLAGDVQFDLIVESVMAFNQHPALAGDVVFSMNVEGVMGFNSGNAIIGNVVFDLFPESSMIFNQHPVISGDIPLDLFPESAMSYTQHPGINGDIIFTLIPEAVFQFGGPPPQYFVLPGATLTDQLVMQATLTDQVITH